MFWAEKIRITLVPLLLIIAGCTVNAPLVDLTYDGVAVAKSDSPVLVSIATGNIEGSGYYFVVPGSVVPLKSEPLQGQKFDVSDQIAFGDFLAAELTKSGMFDAFTEPTGNPAPLYHIDVVFRRTHFAKSSSSYELDVLVNIRRGNDILETTEYLLKDKMTFKNMMWRGDIGITKNRIANTLLTQIIEDVDTWASGVSSPTDPSNNLGKD